MIKKNWEEFQAVGMLWWANRILHIFGWAIVVEQTEDGSIINAYPARVGFRGFTEETESNGFAKVSTWFKDNAEALENEANS